MKLLRAVPGADVPSTFVLSISRADKQLRRNTYFQICPQRRHCPEAVDSRRAYKCLADSSSEEQSQLSLASLPHIRPTAVTMQATAMVPGVHRDKCSGTI